MITLSNALNSNSSSDILGNLSTCIPAMLKNRSIKALDDITLIKSSANSHKFGYKSIFSNQKSFEESVVRINFWQTTFFLKESISIVYSFSYIQSSTSSSCLINASLSLEKKDKKLADFGVIKVGVFAFFSVAWWISF